MAKNEINFTLDELAQLRDIVSRAAREELLPRFTVCQRHEKADGSTVTEADFALQYRLESELAQQWPEFAFLSEEMTVAQKQQQMKCAEAGLWCLDPLDGTTNFAAGVPFFGVSLALLVGGEARAGVIYDPIRDEVFSASKGQGAWLNGERLTPAARAAEPASVRGRGRFQAPDCPAGSTAGLQAAVSVTAQLWFCGPGVVLVGGGALSYVCTRRPETVGLRSGLSDIARGRRACLEPARCADRLRRFTPLFGHGGTRPAAVQGV